MSALLRGEMQEPRRMFQGHPVGCAGRAVVPEQAKRLRRLVTRFAGPARTAKANWGEALTKGRKGSNNQGPSSD